MGIILTPYPDGTLHYKAPKGTMTPALVERIRQHKAELHALVEAFEERAAIAEYCGGLPRAEAEALAWTCLLDAPAHAGCAACGLADSAGVAS
jgi:tubulysin polyketide synthase-like protein